MKNLLSYFVILMVLIPLLISCSDPNEEVNELIPSENEFQFYYNGSLITSDKANELMANQSHVLRDPSDRNKAYIFDDRLALIDFVNKEYDANLSTDAKNGRTASVNPDFGYLYLYQDINFGQFMVNCASSGYIFAKDASNNEWGTPYLVFDANGWNDILSSYKISNYYANSVLVTFWRDDWQGIYLYEFVGSYGYVEENSLFHYYHWNDETSSVSWQISE